MTGPKMRLQPIDLPKVKKEHYTGIFGDFQSVLTHRMAELKPFRTLQATRKIALFQYLLDTVDPKAFAALQDDFLAPDRIDLTVDLPKYIDPIIWFESKLTIATRMDLHRSASKRLIDFGTGPGHFPAVAKFLGHDPVGTELPRRSQGEASGHLYDRLCDVYGVRRISHQITPRPNLQGLGGPYDYATSFLTAFNVTAAKQPWSKASWNIFFHELRSHVLTPDGSLYMTLTHNKVTPAGWRYLTELATSSVDVNRTLYFRDLSFVDGLSLPLSSSV
jgi:hypothetical protein